MKKKKENYLERMPVRAENIKWSLGEKGEVVLEIENKGITNRIAQIFLKKPKISYIHLDEFGSYIWSLLGGEEDIVSIGEKVRSHFGDAAEPLYERLAKYIKTLEDCRFIEFK